MAKRRARCHLCGHLRMLRCVKKASLRDRAIAAIKKKNKPPPRRGPLCAFMHVHPVLAILGIMFAVLRSKPSPSCPRYSSVLPVRDGADIKLCERCACSISRQARVSCMDVRECLRWHTQSRRRNLEFPSLFVSNKTKKLKA